MPVTFIGVLCSDYGPEGGSGAVIASVILDSTETGLKTGVIRL